MALIVTPPPILAPEEFAALTPAQRKMRAQAWGEVVRWYGADHENRYHAPARRAELVRSA